MTFDEEMRPIPVTVRVGQAVDVVGQAGKPKTITGFQVSHAARIIFVLLLLLLPISPFFFFFSYVVFCFRFLCFCFNVFCSCFCLCSCFFCLLLLLLFLLLCASSSSYFAAAFLSSSSSSSFPLPFRLLQLLFKLPLQTHTTPVLLAYGERAELATEEFISLTPVMEGFCILRKNPDYESEVA